MTSAWQSSFKRKHVLILVLGLISMGLAGLASAQYATCYAYFRYSQGPYLDLAAACAAGNWSSHNVLTTSTVEKPGPLRYGSVTSGSAGWSCIQVTTVTGTADQCASAGTCGTFSSIDNNLAVYGSLASRQIYLPSCNFFVQAAPPTQAPRKDPVGDPINPADGSVYKKEDEDIRVSGNSPIVFQRFYNSADPTSTDMGAGWRHTYSRSVVAALRPKMVSYTGPSATVSATYSTPADACQSGFPSIRSQIPGWQSATATYTNNSCVISTAGGVLGTLPVYSQYFLPASGQVAAYDVIRDDGETYPFTINGTALNPPAGLALRLASTPSGYAITDDQDNVEVYDSNGVLQSITSRSGVVQTIAYDTKGRLSTVTDSFGHTLAVGHNTYDAVSSVTLTGGGTVQFSYDGQLRLSTVTNLDSTTRSYVYGNGAFPNALTQEVDENGTAYLNWGYDSQGRGMSSSLASGAYATSLAYNSDGTVTVTDALGAVRTFSYVRSGDMNVTSSISGSQCPGCQDGAATTYDANGWVASRTDYNGNVTCYANDPIRGLELVRVEGFAPGSTCPVNLASYTPAAGTTQRKIATTWSSNFHLPTQIVEATRTTSYGYDTSGNLRTKTTTDTTATPNVSRTWTYTYNSYGQVLTVDGPRTDVVDVTTNTYYNCTTGLECGQLHTVTDAAGHVWTYSTYDGYGQPLTVTDPNGVLTTLAYDARQRLRSRTVGGEATAFTYYPIGLLKTVTLPDNSAITYAYDGAHRLTEVSDGLGNKIVYALDPLGNQTAENTYDPSHTLHRTHTRVFDTLSELYQDVNAAGTAVATTTYGYDSNGNQASAAAPLSRNTGELYDALNRLKQITDPATGVTGFTYDANDNLISVTDPRALVTSYGYNGFDDLTTQVSPDTGSSVNTYDSAGNLATSTDARGAISTYTYDALNRVSSVAYSLGQTTDQTLSFTYDTGTNGVGHLTAASDANHSLSWGYDAVGRVTSKSQTVSGVTKSVGYAYTAGDLTTLTTPSGQTVTYGYNANHQITSVAVNGTTVLNAVTYEPLGPVNGWIWGNATTTRRTYTGDGAISQIFSNGVKTYTYDNALRITGISDTSAGSSSWTYGYDTLDRLTSGVNGTTTRGWTYDADGNRLTETGTSPSTYSISSTSNQITGKHRGSRPDLPVRCGGQYNQLLEHDRHI